LIVGVLAVVLLSLADDRPPLADVERLPSWERLKEMNGEAYDFLSWLDRRRAAFGPSGEDAAAMAELNSIIAFIVIARHARSEAMSEGYRRDQLADIRKRMGRAAYSLGWWPVAGYPYWRLPR
jgi:alkanesulfonate monooxygenase SsuD/methylene tetrahydromethanopterin reductase-like flavin-dependent oxidoreductase (luciferase family)